MNHFFCLIERALLDMQTRLMDGHKVARRTRNHPAIPLRSRIIAMTAFVMPEYRLRCAEAGLVTFIDKPIDIGERFVELNHMSINKCINAKPAYLIRG